MVLVSTSYDTVPCNTCAAPCRPGYEHAAHERSCFAIDAGRTPHIIPLPAGESLDSYCHRIAAEDQAKAHLRETTKAHPPNDNITGIPKDLGQRDQGRWTGWAERQGQGQTFPTPEGKIRCAMCNGITHMYPNCSGCDGKGWV